MSIIGRILGQEEKNDMVNEEKRERQRYRGRIFMLAKGWGFISCKDLPYERIFFHWSGLNQNTLRFPELQRGMECEFETLDIPEKGLRAIKIEIFTQD